MMINLVKGRGHKGGEFPEELKFTNGFKHLWN